MFRRLQYTLSQFMMGRYGTDQFNRFLMVLYLILWVMSLFFGGIVGRVLYLLTLAVLMLTLFRMLSRNFSRRQAENLRFMRVWGRVFPWLRLQWHRMRDVRRWRYRHCPRCKAQLRLPIKRGRRTVTCSRCGNGFQAFFL